LAKSINRLDASDSVRLGYLIQAVQQEQQRIIVYPGLSLSGTGVKVPKTTE